MEVYNNLKPFYLLLLLLYLLLPCHLAQPKFSPSPLGDSPGPAQIPRPKLRPSPAPGSSSDNYVNDDSDTDIQEIDVSTSLFSSANPTVAEPPSESNEFDLSPTLAPLADVNPEVEKICHFTDYPPICLAMVSPYLKVETSAASVLDVAIQAAAQYTNYGQTIAKKLARNHENSPQLAAVLNQCSYNFGSAMDNYGKASEATPEHDKSTLDTVLTEIVAFVAACRDANSQDSELYSISDRLISMTLNCLAISSLMD